jgi:hypothetical protein
MKQCSVNHKAHNLNIKMYKFDEILGLFNLSDVGAISEEDIKRAKAMVLKMHPDKSRLPPDYFLFYKKAFDIVLEFYNNQTKIHRAVPVDSVTYNAYGRGVDSGLNRAANQEIQNNIQKMDTKQFTTVFNDLFEKNMLNSERKRREEERSKWFYSDEPVVQAEASGSGTVHDKVERMREQTANMYLTRYNGVQMLNASGGGGTAAGNLYDDTDEDNGDTYVTSDPFSKLKYDDLRKVHKDQTVFVVSDRKAPIHSIGVDALQQKRSQQDLTPLGKTDAMRMMTDQERRYREMMMKKEYAAKLETMQYEEKAKAVRSQFLRLGGV